MRKILLPIIVMLSLALWAVSSYAATPTPTKKLTPTISPRVTQDTKDQERIEKIKDLVASKVAELKLVEKKAVFGTVKSTTNTQITISDHREQQRLIDIDELTKFLSNKESFGISDIETGDMISAIGLYNKDTKRLLARFISQVSSVPKNFEGVVAAKDSSEFSITVITGDGKKKIVEIETSTKTSSYGEGLTKKSGFSKVETEQRVIIVGFADPKDKDRIRASRIIHFILLPISSDMKKFSDLSGEQIPASTGSAGKVVPITR